MKNKEIEELKLKQAKAFLNIYDLCMVGCENCIFNTKSKSTNGNISECPVNMSINREIAENELEKRQNLNVSTKRRADDSTKLNK